MVTSASIWTRMQKVFRQGCKVEGVGRYLLVLLVSLHCQIFRKVFFCGGRAGLVVCLHYFFLNGKKQSPLDAR